MKLRKTISKYHSWYLCQTLLQIVLLPIKKHKTIQVNVKFTEIIIYHLPISYQRKTVQKRNNNTENVSGNNTKTITQNLQHQQGNLDACRISTTK